MKSCCRRNKKPSTFKRERRHILLLSGECNWFYTRLAICSTEKQFGLFSGQHAHFTLVIVSCVIQEGGERQAAGGVGRRDNFGSKEEAWRERARIPKAKAERQKKGQSLCCCSRSSKERVEQRGMIIYVTGGCYYYGLLICLIFVCRGNHGKSQNCKSSIKSRMVWFNYKDAVSFLSRDTFT